MIRVVPATAEMFAALGEPQEYTAHALAVLRDDELQGLAGYIVDRGRAVVFSKIVGKLPPQTIVKTAKRVIDMAVESGLPVVAVPDPEVPGSKRFLERLGFRFKED